MIMAGSYAHALTEGQSNPSEVTVTITDEDDSILSSFSPEYEVVTSGEYKYLHFPAIQEIFYVTPFGGTFTVEITYMVGEGYQPTSGDVIEYDGGYYTVTEIDGDDIHVVNGIGIEAVWGTIADDDGSPHYFKNLQK